MLLELCHEDTREAFAQYVTHNEIRSPTSQDFEDLERIFQQTRYALVNLDSGNVGGFADDMGAAISSFITWPKIEAAS
jgi:hypothetical protein